MYCEKCGLELPKQYGICPNCGQDTKYNLKKKTKRTLIIGIIAGIFVYCVIMIFIFRLLLSFYNADKNAEVTQDGTEYIYSEEQIDYLEKHIEKYFGNFDKVLHEIDSPDIHVDIAVINPTENRDYYTLVTMGMGAYEMNTPQEYKEYNRAEMIICLPSYWQLDSSDENWYWPIRWLKIMARVPIEENSWLGWGHTVPNGEPFSDNTQLSGILLEYPYTFGEASMTCRLPDFEYINFYQLLPIYEEEMNYKIKYGTDELTELFDEEFSDVVVINRKNYCAGEQT